MTKVISQAAGLDKPAVAVAVSLNSGQNASIAAWESITSGKDKGKTAIFTDTADLDFVADEDVETVDAIMTEHELNIEYDDETETANQR